MITTGEIQRDFGTEICAIVLACRVFVGTATEDELNDFILKNTTDWNKVYAIGRLHQLRPVLYKVLHKTSIPSNIKDKLQADCRAIAMQNLEHIRETVRICSDLDKANVLAVPYKGGMFCQQYYKDAGMREFSDMDFLISHDITILDKLKTALEQWGYIDRSEVPEAFKAMNFRYTREHNFDKYDGDRRRFHAEFHWFTASQVFDFPVPLPNVLLFNDLHPTELFGQQIMLLNDTHHFMALVAHHGLNQRWTLMKYLVDLAMILKNGTELDWSEIDTVSRKYGFNKATNIGLYIADQLLGIKTAYTYKAPTDADAYLKELLSSLNKDRKSTQDVLLLNLAIKDSPAHKIKMIAKYLHYSTKPSILDYQFVKLPKGLFFLYALVKPFRLLTTKSTKH